MAHPIRGSELPARRARRGPGFEKLIVYCHVRPTRASGCSLRGLDLVSAIASCLRENVLAGCVLNRVNALGGWEPHWAGVE